MKTRTILCVFGLLLIVALGVLQALTGDTFFRQARNMKRAREFVPTVRAKLDALPEFRHLRVVEFTAAGGSLLVLGDVASEADAQRVRDVVELTSPPVAVVYQLIPTNEFR